MAVRRIEPAQERRSRPWPWIALVFAVVAFAWLWVRTEDTPTETQVIAAPNAQGTTEVHVDVTLHEATATATAIPTARPTDKPTVVPGLNWCGTATPGATCEVPPLPTPTATAYPDCADMAAIEPGDLCRWR